LIFRSPKRDDKGPSHNHTRDRNKKHLHYLYIVFRLILLLYWVFIIEWKLAPLIIGRKLIFFEALSWYMIHIDLNRLICISLLWFLIIYVIYINIVSSDINHHTPNANQCLDAIIKISSCS
jgi:hypothetical protein